jgi:hypothetical protein
MGEASQARVLARNRIKVERRVVMSVEIGMGQSTRLLAVRGSGCALGFLARGPIYDEALKHPELEDWDL